MSQVIDFETASPETLLDDPRVQQLVSLARRYPQWTISQMVNHLQTRRFNPQSRKQREVLSYKQASIVLQRLNLATPMQRAALLQSNRGAVDGPLASLKFIDYQTADFITLLSDPYVQSLLAVAEIHPNWEVSEMVSFICLGERTYTTTLLHAYKQAEIIFQRLNLATARRREMQFTPVMESVNGERTFRSLFPDLLYYLTHKRQYEETVAQAPVAEQPVVGYSEGQVETLRWFDKFFALTKQFSFVFFGSFLFFFLGALLFRSLFHAQGLFSLVGMFFSFASLVCGLLFFLYSLKYYFTIAIVLSVSRQDEEGHPSKGVRPFFERMFGFSLEVERSPSKKVQQNASGLFYNLDSIHLERQPFVSIHVATYNEKRVIDRFLLAATSMDYDNYEVIVADDSTDETVALLEQWKRHPRVKISHRTTRNGYKGAALKEALKKVDPRTEFILIFDADFIPYPDSIVQFLKYFQQANGSLSPTVIHQSSIAAVQGYQWHILNRSENWITRGVRSEYAGSYIMERTGVEVYHGLKQISGSVYLLRKDVIDRIGWGTSITEDFELTLKLYEQGFKVLYTPYIQTPAEAVATVKRLIRQRMRWAEGHSFNVKRMWKGLLQSPLLTRAEKFEFVYLAPYYLQAFFFLLGTACWFTAEYLFQVRLPFWTETLGWSLVLTNLFALPLMNLIGLFLEESESKDYVGLFSFVVLSYLVAPFQAFAAVKGFLEKEEGPWFRTPKTGRITDSFTPGRFYRFVRGFFGQPISSSLSQSMLGKVFPIAADSAHIPIPPAFATVKQVPQFRNRYRWTGKAVVSLFLVIVVFLNYLTFFAPSAHAAWFNSGYLKKKSLTIDHTKVGKVDVNTANITSFHNGTSVSSLTWSFTTGSQSNRVLLVGVQIDSGHSVSTVTFNTTTSLAVVPGGTQNCSTGCRSELWYVKNPPASTTANVVVTANGSGSIVGGAVELYNVDQTTPFGTVTTGKDSGSQVTSFSMTSQTAANQLVIESVAGGGAGSLGWQPNSSQTTLWSNNGNNDGIVSSFQASSSSTTLSWTDASADFWADVAVPVNPAALSNFPVLVSFTDTDLKVAGSGGLVQNSNGFDIIFTDSTESTKLDHEIEFYASTTGQIVMWVRIPTLSATTDTLIYMYFDNSSITTTQANPTGVWNTNYKGVWHMDEASGSLSDSTSNANTAGKTGTVTYQAAGKIYKGIGFGGTTGNNFSVTDNSSINFGTGSFTYGSWVYVTSGPSTGTFYDYFYKGGLSSSDSGYAMYVNDNPSLNGKVVSGTTVAFNNGANISTGTWYYFVTVIDKTANLLHVFQNGVDQGTVSISSLGSTTNTKKLYFGTDDGGNGPLNGRMEEVEINNTALTSGWITTEYNNQNSPSTFYTESSIATNSTNPAIEQQINLKDANNTPGDGTTNLGISYVDTSKYSGTATYILEVTALVSSGTGSVSYKYGAGTGAVPSGGSTATISGINNTGTYKRWRTTISSMSTGNVYLSAMSGTGLNIYAARIIIDQSSTSLITATETQIEMGNQNVSTTSTSDVTLTHPVYWKYDSSKYDGTVTIYFETTQHNSTTGDTATSSLYVAGSSCSSQVSGSAVTTTTTSDERDRSSAITLTSGTTYMMCFHASAATAFIDSAKIIIDQSNNSGLTAMEMIHYHDIDTQTTSGNGYTSMSTGPNLYDPSVWSGGTQSFFTQATMETSSGGTAYDQLYNNTAASAIANSPITTTNTSFTLVRTPVGTVVTMPGSASDIILQFQNANTATTTIDQSALVIDVTSLATPEHIWFFFPLILFVPPLMNYWQKKRKRKSKLLFQLSV